MTLMEMHSRTKKSMLFLVLVFAHLVAIGIVLTRLGPQGIAARVEQTQEYIAKIDELERENFAVQSTIEIIDRNATILKEEQAVTTRSLRTQIKLLEVEVNK